MKDMNQMMDAIEEGDGEFVVELARRLWQLQTSDEQAHEVTVYRNDVGYNSADAPWIGRFLDNRLASRTIGGSPETKQVLRLADKRLLIELRIRMLKYREQLSHLCTDAEIEAALTVKTI